ncbi:MAG: HIT family protein [Thomasclavelia sp.]|nr:HIT family protein [Thomasclavelia sp.]
MEDCIFCKIGKGDIPSFTLYEDDVCKAFLDLSQATKGHTLVIPKKHFNNFLEVDDQTLSHIMKVTKELANKIVKNLDAKGVNILTNTNEVAGQSVQHFHVHILPRYTKEELDINFIDHSNDYDMEKLKSEILK